ncbi:MAG: DUF4177 domain-containing protein [Lachnospiraceae bacterium]|nr:DUF4177 domain-containing protein [Lachnospiraceae bacterium]
MKTCPECGEILGDSVEMCFNCYYNFKLKRKITKDEREENNKKQAEIESQKAEIESQKAEIERQKTNEKRFQLSKNPLFEYKVVIVNNLETGEINQIQMKTALDTWSEQGWRLHSVFNNELGKTSSSVSVGFLGTTVNATIDQTVLIFERCIKAGTD